jgi:hypothetical protein
MIYNFSSLNFDADTPIAIASRGLFSIHVLQLLQERNKFFLFNKFFDERFTLL